MQKRNAILVFAVLLLVATTPLLAGCGKPGAEEMIVGYWEWRVENGWVSYEFLEDGTGITQNSDKFTYSIEGNSLSLSYTGSNEVDNFEIVELNEKTLVMTYGGWMTTTLTLLPPVDNLSKAIFGLWGNAGNFVAFSEDGYFFMSNIGHGRYEIISDTSVWLTPASDKPPFSAQITNVSPETGMAISWDKSSSFVLSAVKPQNEYDNLANQIVGSWRIGDSGELITFSPHGEFTIYGWTYDYHIIRNEVVFFTSDDGGRAPLFVISKIDKDNMYITVLDDLDDGFKAVRVSE